MRLNTLKCIRRVTEILEESSVPSEVPSERNRADMCSSGAAFAEDLLKDQRD